MCEPVWAWFAHSFECAVWLPHGDSSDQQCASSLARCILNCQLPGTSFLTFNSWVVLRVGTHPFQDDHQSYRRKFRSQTSDNMQRWKGRGGKSHGGEVKKWEDQRRERVGSKKMQVREKVGKARFTVFFQWFGAPEGREVTSLKRRARSQLARWEMKNCTLLWREAHFQVKMHKTHHSQTTFGSWDVEKVHAVVARSTFPSRNVQNTTCSDLFWKLRCRKSARRCGAKHIFKSKVQKKNLGFCAFFDVQMWTKWTVTNLTHLTNLTDLTTLSQLTNKITN